MWKVAVIGAGNLGSRHMQAVAELGDQVCITVIDPSAASLRHASDVLSETRIRKENVRFCTDFPEVRDEYDVAIFATSSLPRKDAFYRFIQNNSVRYCLFEKVLFPRLSDYDEVMELLDKHGIQAWVNCPMRMYPGWQRIYSQLKDYKGHCQLFIEGGNWGLACNSIHYIDMMSWITGDQEQFTYDVSELENRVVPSKRNGYAEFLGTLNLAGDRCTSIRLTAKDCSSALPALHLITDIAHYRVEEYSQSVFKASDDNGWRFERFEFPIYYQSQLTDKVVRQLMTKGDCSLTPYRRSAEIHKPYLNAFLEKYSLITGRSELVCPIT